MMVSEGEQKHYVCQPTFKVQQIFLTKLGLGHVVCQNHLPQQNELVAPVNDLQDIVIYLTVVKSIHVIVQEPQ